MLDMCYCDLIFSQKNQLAAKYCYNKAPKLLVPSSHLENLYKMA